MITQSQEELYMRQQAGSNLLLKQMTDQQQMMTEPKQQHLSLSNSMNKHQLEYKPSTGLYFWPFKKTHIVFPPLQTFKVQKTLKQKLCHSLRVKRILKSDIT